MGWSLSLQGDYDGDFIVAFVLKVHEHIHECNGTVRRLFLL